MSHLTRTTARTFRRKLALMALALASLALASVAAGPVLQAAGIKEPPGQDKRTFSISGNLTTQLSPGVSGALNLSFGNPNQQALGIEDLLVVVEGTNSASCSPHNFAAVQFSGTYPIVIPRGNSQLSQAVSNSTKWPRVSMINRPFNQDACKGVTVNLAYSGVASK
jgi:hypothetical protein